jgi:hypothetical protein
MHYESVFAQDTNYQTFTQELSLESLLTNDHTYIAISGLGVH